MLNITRYIEAYVFDFYDVLGGVVGEVVAMASGIAGTITTAAGGVAGVVAGIEAFAIWAGAVGMGIPFL